MKGKRKGIHPEFEPGPSLSLSLADADLAVPPQSRTTTPYMTKYERARVLGTRALQIR